MTITTSRSDLGQKRRIYRKVLGQTGALTKSEGFVLLGIDISRRFSLDIPYSTVREISAGDAVAVID